MALNSCLTKLHWGWRMGCSSSRGPKPWSSGWGARRQLLSWGGSLRKSSEKLHIASCNFLDISWDTSCIHLESFLSNLFCEWLNGTSKFGESRVLYLRRNISHFMSCHYTINSPIAPTVPPVVENWSFAAVGSPFRPGLKSWSMASREKNESQGPDPMGRRELGNMWPWHMWQRFFFSKTHHK